MKLEKERVSQCVAVLRSLISRDLSSVLSVLCVASLSFAQPIQAKAQTAAPRQPNSQTISNAFVGPDPLSMPCSRFVSAYGTEQIGPFSEGVSKALNGNNVLGNPANVIDFVGTECRLHETISINQAVINLLQQARQGKLPAIPIGGASANPAVQASWDAFEKWLHHQGPRPVLPVEEQDASVGAGPSENSDVQDLISSEASLDAFCRLGHQASCDQHEKILGGILKQGWCYGPPIREGRVKTWAECTAFRSDPGPDEEGQNREWAQVYHSAEYYHAAPNKIYLPSTYCQWRRDALPPQFQNICNRYEDLFKRKEADWHGLEVTNGTRYEIDLKSIQHYVDGIAEVSIRQHDGSTRETAFVLRDLMFDCHDHFTDLFDQTSELLSAKPGSVVAHAQFVACAKRQDSAEKAKESTKPDDEHLPWLFLVGLLCLAFWIYFFPTTVAYRRKHHNALAIFVLNTFLGWTFLGWIVALVWAVTKPAS